MSQKIRIVVAGDVCIDWVSVPVESLARSGTGPEPRNWQLRGGRHMYALRGGAWLTAVLVEAAVAGSPHEVVKPAAEPHLESVAPERIIHSMLSLDGRERARDGRSAACWTVASFEGYAGPPPGQSAEVLPPEQGRDDPAAELVVLDDAGNGFRDAEAAWPTALAQAHRPLVLLKIRRPLATGALWQRLEAFHFERTIALLSANELRGEGAEVSRGLSWERTATDLVLALARDPRFATLRRCPWIVVPFGIEAALLLRTRDHEVAEAELWYLPDHTEGERSGSRTGDMSGFGSAFAAGVAAALAGSGATPEEGALRTGIEVGLSAMHRLLDEGFGPCRDGAGRPVSPAYPVSRVFSAGAGLTAFARVTLPPLPPAPRSPEAIADFRSWSILESKRRRAFADLSAEVARRGARKAFEGIPAGRFGKLETVDRPEIESYRAAQNLLREFLRNPSPERPLSLAVFGPPGSGKSFGVTQVAQSLAGVGQVEKLDFNVSQWDSSAFLAQALHRVRDHALGGKVPLVFFDEFDAPLGGQPLGWLKFFLAPMQDGLFADGMSMHRVGKAVFVFAGGTAPTFAEFQSRAEALPDAGDAKVPDFLSRLRGHVDVFGFDPPYGTNLVRRALVLRTVLLRKHRALEDPSGALRIDDGVLRAFLHVPRYLHGARSLEAIVDMSSLTGRELFDPSLLPPRRQLDLHVDGERFLELVRYHHALGDRLERVAREIHELYFRDELGNGQKVGDRPALRPWEELGDLYRNSNREQAASYPSLLAAAGYELEEGEPEPGIGFAPEEVERLARLEHERWMAERRLRQPDHPDLRPWEQLAESDRDKDRRSIEAMPVILGAVGLRLRRLG